MVAYLKNRSPISVLGGMTLIKAAEGLISDISHLRMIRSLIYIYIPKEKRTKL